MNVFVSYDGDKIGRMVGRARLADDADAIRRISQSIDHGNDIWRSWCESHGGNVVEMAGDEGTFEISADYLDELPKIREQYQGDVGSTVSVGVGIKISESARALIAAKLRGGDRIEFYTDEVNEIVTQAEKNGQRTEENKIADEYLNKAAPAMHPGTFSGASAPSAPTVSGPTATQGPHEEVSTIMNEQSAEGQSPELTHAGDDFLNSFHDSARSQEQEDTEGHAQSTKNVDDVKKKIVVALQMLKQQAPVMEQIKQTAPDAYQAMVGLAQAVIGLSREINPVKKSENSLTKAESRNPRELMTEAVRGVLKTDHGHNCMNGDCYAGSESLYHLLGGNDAGWTPHVVSHENAPHWYLKNRHSGRIVDATSNQFENPVPYHLGRGQSFVTELPSKRANQIISHVLTKKSELHPGQVYAAMYRFHGSKLAEQIGEEDLDPFTDEDRAILESIGVLKDNKLQKMAIADIPAGKKMPKKAFDSPESYDYSHVLPEEHRAKGYTLSVERPPGDSAGLAAVLYKDKQKQHVGFLGARLDTRPGHIDIKNAHINQEHRGTGLGIPMYEALYAHAKHRLGITHSIGGEHSTSAGAVHKKLAAKHGLNYKPQKDLSNNIPSKELNTPFDGRYYGYRYALKNEWKTEKDPANYDASTDGDLEKSGLPMPGASAHHRVTLPVGSTLNQKVKVQHSDGKNGWVSVQAGQVRSQDPSGHPISSRNPGGK